MATVRQTTTTTTSSRSGGGQGCLCVWNWSFVFAVLDLVVGILVSVQSCLLMFVTSTFRNFIVGVVGLCMGLGILSSTTMTCSSVYSLCHTRFGFYWTWAGRGLFYIVVGCIVADDPQSHIFGFISFCLCCVLGFTYIALECCSCMSNSLPKAPSPLCGTAATAAGANQAQAPAPRAAAPKTNTQNPFGAPKEDDDDCVC